MNTRVMNVLRKEAKHKSNQYEGISDSSVLEGLSAYGVPYLNLVNMATTPLGQLAGLARGIDKSEEKKLTDKLNEYSGTTFLPASFGYRDTLRHRLADRKASKGKVDRKAIASEFFGNFTSPLLLTALSGVLGAGAGYLVDRHKGDIDLNNTIDGGIIGGAAGAIGSTVALLTGLGLGMYKRRRSQEDHAKYLKDDRLVDKNLLLPGYAAYNTGRRMRSQTAAALDA